MHRRIERFLYALENINRIFSRTKEKRKKRTNGAMEAGKKKYSETKGKS